MPIYMDRHDMPEDIKAEHVAEMHQADLKIEHKFGCRGITYWCDEKRKTAFCLIEAPNKKALQNMHDIAHGDIPHSIIEVDDAIVESFLGRIEDPEKSQNTELNIINDPAFRTIMVMDMNKISLKNLSSSDFGSAIQLWNKKIIKIFEKFNGSIVSQKPDHYLISYESVTKAILCALEIQNQFSNNLNGVLASILDINIGISAGVPVTNKEKIFEDTVEMANLLSGYVKGKIVISQEVNDLYESENMNAVLNNKLVVVLAASDECFLHLLSDVMDKEWKNAVLNVDDFGKSLGYSKSQFYRKMIAITGKSPNSFIKDFRVNQALKLLDKKVENISEIAFQTGFNSPAYFSKCFSKTFGVLPSEYTKQNIITV